LSEVRFRERRWLQLVIALLGSVVSLGLLALMLAPSLVSVAAVEVVDGPKSVAIGTAHEIEPPAGWSVQPTVDRGALLPGDGLVLRSPDRVLTVEMRVVAAGQQLVAGLEGDSAAGLGSRGVAVGPVLTETLESGAELGHGLSAEGDFVALLGLEGADDQLLVEARTDDPALLDAYRAELAALLLDVRTVRAAAPAG